MGRSLKKGPYVDVKLLKKIEKLNESGKKDRLRHGLVLQQLLRNL